MIMRLSVPVKVTKRAYEAFLRQLGEASYEPVVRDNSVQVQGVEVAYANAGGYWVFPVNFAKYEKSEKRG